MPFTLADLVAVPSLGLSILACSDALDHPVQWAHVSELLDPTPFLEGGELLLTVGIWFGEGVSAEDYVSRLAVGADGLHSLVSTPDGRAFAAALLQPLTDIDGRGRSELVASLRAWLEHNGHWDGAAAALGVHRHTLRSRIQRIEDLLSRDLDAAGARAELWTALRLLDTMERA